MCLQVGLSSFLIPCKAKKRAPTTSAVSTSGKTTVRTCQGLMKDFETSTKQTILSTYRMCFPVGVTSAYTFETLGQFTIVVAKKCNGMRGSKEKGKHISCSHCRELKAFKIYQTLQQRAEKACEVEMILKRREVDPSDIKKLKLFYKQGINEKNFTEEGMLLAKVRVVVLLKIVAFCLTYFTLT